MPDTPQPKKHAQKKIAKSLVAFGSAAIVTVYAAGYARTQSAEAQFDVQALPTSVTPALPATEVTATSTPVARFRPIFPIVGSDDASPRSRGRGAAFAPTMVPTVAPTGVPAQAATGKYKDGSYVGLGRSRHGNIEATVVVQGGKIVSAKISQCLTRYPCSMIAGLPGEVVAQQSAAVDFVSGATDSSTAFQQAVANALAQGA